MKYYPNCHPFNKLYADEFPELMYSLDNEETFLKCVEVLYKNYDVYVDKCSLFARKNFSWDSAVEDLIDKMHNLVGTK